MKDDLSAVQKKLLNIFHALQLACLYGLVLYMTTREALPLWCAVAILPMLVYGFVLIFNIASLWSDS